MVRLSVKDSRAIEYCLKRIDFALSGHYLSRNDCERVGNSLFFLMNCLLDITNVVRNHARAKEIARTYSTHNIGRFVDIWVKTDIGVLIEQQKSALQVIRHIPEGGCRSMKEYTSLCTCFGFDRSLECNEYLLMLLKELCLHPDIELFRYLNTVLQLISRLTLRDIDWIEEENIQAYKDFEDLLLHQDAIRYLNPERVELIFDMQSIIREWFQDFSYEGSVGQHGYGATNQVRRSVGTEAKYAAMSFDYKTALAAKYTAWRPIPHCWPGLLDQQLSCFENHISIQERITRVQLVPKGINKKRVVSMEDTTNQFFQKNMQLLMSRHFGKHPEMHIDLHNQSRNRDLTMIGSKYRNYGTIDLSSASDSVTWELVKTLFEGTPIYKYLLATRTRICELPDGTHLHMRKAYPMGSALCFPIECTVFSAVIAAVNRRSGIDTNYRVYGDDMVVHKLIFDKVMDALKLLGFFVNDTKSFEPALPFKESCGIECFSGYDVSPLRISRKWDVCDIYKRRHRHNLTRSYTSSSTQLAALYDIGNTAFDMGYSHIRYACIRIAEDNYSSVLYSHNHEYGFLSMGVNLNKNAKRFRICADDFDPWRTYIKSYGIRSSIAKGSDDLRYSKLLEEYDATNRTSLSVFDDRLDVACGSARTRLTLVRVPLALIYAFDTDIERWNGARSRDYL